MEAPAISLPTYPIPAQFRDPYGDWLYDFRHEDIRRKDPRTLTERELCYIFNSWLPAGSFEEMAAYVPHALRLLAAQERQETGSDLLEHLIIWCHLEQAGLQAREHRAFLEGLQAAFMQLFRYWTSRTDWWKDKRGCYLRHASCIETLLGKGDEIGACGYREPLPWLASAQYLPQLAALGSVSHAAWALYVSDPDTISPFSPLPLPAATRRRAVDMVDEWLLTTATPEEVGLWEGCVTRHREQLSLIPA